MQSRKSFTEFNYTYLYGANRQTLTVSKTGDKLTFLIRGVTINQ